MLFVADVGNTNIVFGAFRGDELLFELRIKTELGRTRDEYLALLEALLKRKLGSAYSFSGAIVSSVVPPITPDLVDLLHELVGVEPLVVGPGIKTGMPLRVTEPQAVGSDRVVNAVAAREIFGSPALVIDFGTATSFDVINASGEYEGGIIAPGVMVSLDSLVRNTAKLPRIELSWPKTVIGKNTVAAMQSGSVLGYLCLVEGLIERLECEAGKFAHIVATGGLGRLFSERSARIRHYDPHLTLKGLKIIAAMNAGAK